MEDAKAGLTGKIFVEHLHSLSSYHWCPVKCDRSLAQVSLIMLHSSVLLTGLVHQAWNVKEL